MPTRGARITPLKRAVLSPLPQQAQRPQGKAEASHPKLEAIFFNLSHGGKCSFGNRYQWELSI